MAKKPKAVLPPGRAPDPPSLPPRDAQRPTLKLEGDPYADPKAAGQIHGAALAAMVYGTALDSRLRAAFPSVELSATAMVHVRDMIDRMAPKDPAEEMLVAQLVATHARVMHLTAFANIQTTLEPMKAINEYADRAVNTYRRLMLALAEYRRPPRTGDTFTAIKQANIAGQQVIQNHEESEPTKTTNEQGCEPPTNPGRQAPALPADSGWVDVPAFLRPNAETVGAVNRAADAGGQGSISGERHEAR